jgi:hypothetical protein
MGINLSKLFLAFVLCGSLTSCGVDVTNMRPQVEADMNKAIMLLEVSPRGELRRTTTKPSTAMITGEFFAPDSTAMFAKFKSVANSLGYIYEVSSARDESGALSRCHSDGTARFIKIGPSPDVKGMMYLQVLVSGYKRDLDWCEKAKAKFSS